MANIGQVHITGVNVNPTEVTPGGIQRVTVTLTETAEIVLIGGKLRLCNPDTSLSATGLETEVVVTTEWGDELRETVCVPVFNLSSGEIDVSFDVTSPNEPGEYSVSAFIESTKTDDVSDRITNTVTVSEGAAAEPEPEPDEPKDGGSGNWLIDTAFEYPVATGILGVGSYIAIRSAFDGE